MITGDVWRDLCGPPPPWKRSFLRKNGPTSRPLSVSHWCPSAHWAHSLYIQWALCNCWKIHSPPIYDQCAQQKGLQVAYLQLQGEIEVSRWCGDGTPPSVSWLKWRRCLYFPSLTHTSPQRRGHRPTRLLSLSISLVFVSFVGAGRLFWFGSMSDTNSDHGVAVSPVRARLTHAHVNYLNYLSVVENGDS